MVFIFNIFKKQIINKCLDYLYTVPRLLQCFNKIIIFKLKYNPKIDCHKILYNRPYLSSYTNCNYTINIKIW